MNTANFKGRPHAEAQFALPRHCVLEGFTDAAAATGGLCLNNLNAHDLIICRTLNSEYRLLVLDPVSRRVRVQGGGLFAEPTDAVLTGASYGGSMIRLGWVCTGMQIELVRQAADNAMMNVVTSPVEALRLEPSS